MSTIFSDTNLFIVNILFINSDEALQLEFNEFSSEIDASNYYSNSLMESISILNDKTIDIVILRISKLSDASILKYIHDYYKDIKILISAREDFEEALSIFKQVQFEKIKSPMVLSDIKAHMAY